MRSSLGPCTPRYTGAYPGGVAKRTSPDDRATASIRKACRSCLFTTRYSCAYERPAIASDITPSISVVSHMKADRPSSPYPHPHSEAVSRVMRGNRKRDTQPELALRSALHALGLRFRKHYVLFDGQQRATVDVAFPSERVAVFLDGCFWHSCPQHGTAPRTNTEYWSPKLLRNIERDRDVDARLRAAGWMSIRVWEHEDPVKAAKAIGATVASRRHPRRPGLGQ